jgi:hypothetical protein
MIIEGPLGELDLCDRLRLEPDTVYDFFLRKCPLSSFFSPGDWRRGMSPFSNLSIFSKPRGGRAAKPVSHLGR